MGAAEQQLKTARRRGAERGILFFYIDMDNLKQINDVFGHQQGSRALASIAGLLKKTFRELDILARVGGDEFTALAVEAAHESADLIVARLRENLRRHNATADAPSELSFSVGVARPEADSVSTIEELAAAADAPMYEEKRRQGSLCRARPQA